jgi:hypothetical protein
MCRAYPRKFTAFELVGRAYVLAGNVSGLTQKVQLLVEDLEQKDREILSRAVQQVLDELERNHIDEFRTGALIIDREGQSRIPFDDQAVPGQYVKELKRVLEFTHQPRAKVEL